MGIARFVGNVFFAVCRIPFFLVSSGLYFLSHFNYEWLNRKEKVSSGVLAKEWLLPYYPEEYWEKRAGLLLNGKSIERGFPDERRELLEKEFVGLLEKTNFSNCLEIGCGIGKNLSLIENSFSKKKIVGIDFSKKMLELAKKNVFSKRAMLLQMNATGLDFEDNSFDLVFACETLMHLPKKDLNKVLEEMIRVSRKDVVLIEPDIAVIPFLARFFHAPHVFYHNYAAEMNKISKAKLLWRKPIAYKSFSIFVFRKK